MQFHHRKPDPYKYTPILHPDGLVSRQLVTFADTQDSGALWSNSSIEVLECPLSILEG